MQPFNDALTETFYDRLEERRADIDAFSVLACEVLAICSGNAHPPFAVERAHNRRHERLDRHRDKSPSSPGGRGRSREFGRWSGRRWEPLGQHGIAWEFARRQ